MTHLDQSIDSRHHQRLLRLAVESSNFIEQEKLGLRTSQLRGFLRLFSITFLCLYFFFSLKFSNAQQYQEHPPDILFHHLVLAITDEIPRRFQSLLGQTPALYLDPNATQEDLIRLSENSGHYMGASFALSEQYADALSRALILHNSGSGGDLSASDRQAFQDHFNSQSTYTQQQELDLKDLALTIKTAKANQEQLEAPRPSSAQQTLRYAQDLRDYFLRDSLAQIMLGNSLATVGSTSVIPQIFLHPVSMISLLLIAYYINVDTKSRQTDLNLKFKMQLAEIFYSRWREGYLSQGGHNLDFASIDDSPLNLGSIIASKLDALQILLTGLRRTVLFSFPCEKALTPSRGTTRASRPDRN